MSRRDLETFIDKSMKFPADAVDSQGLSEIAIFLYESKLHTEAGKPMSEFASSLQSDRNDRLCTHARLGGGVTLS